MTKVARLIADEAREEQDREIAEKLLLLKVDENVIAKNYQWKCIDIGTKE